MSDINNEYLKQLQEANTRIDQIENILSETPSGGMLSSIDFMDLHYDGTKDDYINYLDIYLKKLKGERYESEDERIMIEDNFFKLVTMDGGISKKKARFLIYPFKPLNVTLFSYDLSIGEEIYSIRKRGNSLRFENMRYENMKEKEYPFEPGETIIILTEEYIALPPQYSATVWPRFGLVSEGIFQSMVKIDPTWRGKLAVALTNFSPGTYPIKQGKLFGTLIIYELTRKSSYALCKTSDLVDIPIEIPQQWAKDNRNKINKKLIEKGLFELCQIDLKNNIYSLLIKKKNRKKPEFDILLDEISDDEEWRTTVENAINEVVKSPNRGMDYLDLKDLNPPFIPAVPTGKRLTKSDLEKDCSERDLEDAAILNGGAFRWLPCIPRLVINKVESDITPKIRTDVSSYLFPKVVTVTLTVIGLLSLIAAIVGLFLSKYHIASPVYIDWAATLFWGVVVLGIIALFGLSLLLCPGIIDSMTKVVGRISESIGKQRITEVFSGLDKRVRDLENKVNQLVEKV